MIVFQPANRAVHISHARYWWVVNPQIVPNVFQKVAVAWRAWSHVSSQLPVQRHKVRAQGRRYRFPPTTTTPRPVKAEAPSVGGSTCRARRDPSMQHGNGCCTWWFQLHEPLPLWSKSWGRRPSAGSLSPIVEIGGDAGRTIPPIRAREEEPPAARVVPDGKRRRVGSCRAQPGDVTARSSTGSSRSVWQFHVGAFCPSPSSH